jgi:hypothetical protein
VTRRHFVAGTASAVVAPHPVSAQTAKPIKMGGGRKGVEGVFEQSNVVRVLQMLREIEPRFAA